DREVVAALGEAISQRIGEPRYHLWVERNTRFTWQDDLLVVGVPNHLYLEWLQKTFADPVLAAASDVLGRPMQVRFAIDPELFQAARREQAECQPAHREDRDAKTLASPPKDHQPRTDPQQPDEPRTTSHPPRPAKRTRRWHRLGDF